MDLIRYVKFVLADQFFTQPVEPNLLCISGPFSFADGQPIEVYLQENPQKNSSLEILYYTGLADALTLDKLHQLYHDNANGSDFFKKNNLTLLSNRLALPTTRDNLLEDLIRFNENLITLDAYSRKRLSHA